MPLNSKLSPKTRSICTWLRAVALETAAKPTLSSDELKNSVACHHVPGNVPAVQMPFYKLQDGQKPTASLLYLWSTESLLTALTDAQQ